MFLVVCEEDKQDTSYVKHAPTIVIEVLSPSTRRTDVTIKKEAYLSLPSLQEYVLVEQDKCEIEVFRRKDSWASTYYVIGDTLTLESVDVILTVQEIYDRVLNDDMQKFLAELAEQEATGS